MLFKRKVYSKLLSWKNECNGSKALLIEGARRIGKSTIALEFAKNEYEQYLLIDFSIATDKTPRDKYIDKEGYLGKNEIKNGIIVRSKSHIYNQTRRFYYEMH